ncbi:MAG: 50S ribosomal protein L25/general stress protein Ctc [Neisseriaceae bacterium]
MNEIIKATKRPAVGTGASRRLRKEGLVPAILYGSQKDPITIAVEQTKIFRAISREEFHTSLLKLELEGSFLEVVVRAFQLHPFKPLVQHLDFQIVDPDQPLRLKVPLKFINADIAPSVKLYGATIFKIANSVEVLAPPKNFPQYLTVDLKDIRPGQILHVSDIQLPEKVEIVALKRGDNPPIVSASGREK